MISSDRGDFKVCPTVLVTKYNTLYEYDPDDKVAGKFIGAGSCYIFKSVVKYDPSGNNPEFYVVTSMYQVYDTSVKVYDR